MVYVGPYDLIAIAELLGVEGVDWSTHFCFYKLPNIVLCDMVGIVGAAADFVEQSVVRNTHLVSMQVVFGFEITQKDRLVHVVQLSLGIYLMQ